MTVRIFKLYMSSILIDCPHVSMPFSVLKLPFNKPWFASKYCSAESMWLICTIGYHSFIGVIQSTKLNFIYLFNRHILWIELNFIILIFSIEIIYIQRSLLFKCICGIVRYLRILLKNLLNLILDGWSNAQS